MQGAERAECCDDDLCQYSILPEGAVDRVRLHGFTRPFGVVAIEADLFAQYAPVLLCRLPVDLVAAQARRFRSVYNRVAHVSIDVAIAGIQAPIIRQREVHLEIPEQ